MVHKLSHTILRNKTYWYNRRVPKKHAEVFGATVRARLSSDKVLAAILSNHLTSVLDQAWDSDRTSPIDVQEVIMSSRPRKVQLVEVADEYVDVRCISHASIRHGVQALVAVAGNRDVGNYTRDDVRAMVASLQNKGNKTVTVRKRLSAVSAVISYAYAELDIDRRNPFSRVVIKGEGMDSTPRGVFQIDQLLEGYREALSSNSHVLNLFPVLGETGCRLAEIVGLKIEDVDLRDDILHIRLNELRRLKTSGSTRSIPLLPMAKLALVKAIGTRSTGWVFPQYMKDSRCTATHASNALAKFTKSRFDGLTPHSLRHTFRDRLRSVEAPLEITDQIGGWSSSCWSSSTRVFHGLCVEVLSKVFNRIINKVSDRVMIQII